MSVGYLLLFFKKILKKNVCGYFFVCLFCFLRCMAIYCDISFPLSIPKSPLFQQFILLSVEVTVVSSLLVSSVPIEQTLQVDILDLCGTGSYKWNLLLWLDVKKLRT